MFVILSGSSGAGKNTIIWELIKKYKNIEMFPTFTSREKREGEKDGNPFYFLTKEEFQKNIKNNEFIEHEHIHGNFYGSMWKVFNEYVKKNKIMIKDIGVQGTFNLSTKIADKTQVVKVFLRVPKRELIKRLQARGETNIKLRMKRFGYENSFIKKYDYIIDNHDLHKTCDYIKKIVEIKDYAYKILPIKKLEKIKFKKIGKYMEKIKTGKVLKPVKIVLTDEGNFLLNGVERYVASIKMKKDICKIIVDKNIKPKQIDIKQWKEILN